MVHDIIGTDDPEVAFSDADAIFLVGSRPRTKDMVARSRRYWWAHFRGPRKSN